jgi:hypothetical protein
MERLSGSIFVARFGKGAEVKLFSRESFKILFCIKVGTDLEWNSVFTRLIRLNVRPE